MVELNPMAELAGAACFKWSQDKAVLLGVDPFEFRYGLLPYLDELCHIRRIVSLYVMVVGSTGLFLPFMGLIRPSRLYGGCGSVCTRTAGVG